jgi:hypothetical protein
MAVNYSNLNGSVDTSSPTRDTWNSYNFFHTAIYQRTVILNGGDLTATERWWKTPLPYPPFNVRAPENLLTETEWRSLRDWICDNVQGGWIDDVDFYNESQRFGTMTKQDNSLIQLVQADTGPTVTTAQSRDGDYVIHTFTQSDVLHVRAEGIIEYLIVGGGGGGGGWAGGGGGGGGTVLTGFKRLTVGTYDIVIGAGGNAGTDIGNSGLQSQAGVRDSTAGGNTTAFGLTAYGGGAGGATSTNTFATVATIKDAPQANPFVVDNSYAIGSGGGGGAQNTAGAVSTSHIKGSNKFGYRGGDGINLTTTYIGGGGGGAGGPGQNANAWLLSDVAITGTSGQFSCDPTTNLQAGMTVVVSGTLSGTGSITGYSSPTVYQISECTDASFILTTTAGAAITTTAGTTTGLVFYSTTRQGGAGGIGISSTISDNEVYYGGGGAGGGHAALDRGNSGGLGGGASSKDANLKSATSNNGEANTGGGGAGASGFTGEVGATGGFGGSGIVIIRYPKNLAFGKKKPGNVAAFGQQLSG